MSSQSRVLVIGATGATGGSIVNGLIRSGEFHVVALIRPSSESKPETADLRARGVEIRIGDLQDSIEKLKETVSDIDTLISTAYAFVVPDQKNIFIAAKEAGVKRVIPSDFATVGARGVQDLRDWKLDIRDFVRGLGVNYTFIDVGWWMQAALPYPLRSDGSGDSVDKVLRSRRFYGDGDKKNIYTHLPHIGDFVARIILDERTLNQYVVIWEDELTLEEARSIGERVSGDGDALKAKRIPVSKEELFQYIQEGKEEYPRTKTTSAAIKWISNQYQYSMHILGENSLKNAKAMGALDARELYPDLKTITLEEYAKEFYENLPQPYV